VVLQRFRTLISVIAPRKDPVSHLCCLLSVLRRTSTSSTDHEALDEIDISLYLPS
jgi:hypothetical protein